MRKEIVSVLCVVAALVAAPVMAAEGESYLSQPRFLMATFDGPPAAAPEAPAVAAAPVMEDFSCSGCNHVDCCCPSWRLGASVEATFFWPTVNGTSTYTELGSISGGTLTTNTYDAGSEQTDDLFAAPRIWIGAKRDCWGIGTRFWWMDQCVSSQSDTISPTSFFTIDRELEAYTIDLELTRDVCVLGNEAMLSAGIRYGRVENGASAITNVNWNPIGAPALTSATATSLREFGGTGPTFAAQGTRQIRCSNFHVFWGARGSVLFGDGYVGAITSATAVDAVNGPSATQTNFGLAGGDGAAFLGELQLGLQYERQLACVPCTAFVRGAFEYQYWNTDYNSSAASWSLAGVSTAGGPSYGAYSTAAASGLELDLIGFTVGTGLTW